MKNKIAIRVNNKREFDALMREYNKKGWTWHNGYSCLKKNVPDTWVYPLHIRYKNECTECSHALTDEEILDFATFAQIAGIGVVNEVKISLNKGLAIVKQNAVYFEGNPCDFNLSGRQLEEINAAYKSLQ